MQKTVEAELLNEESSGDPEDKYADTSAHTDNNKYQDVEASAHKKLTEDKNAGVSHHLEVREDTDA